MDSIYVIGFEDFEVRHHLVASHLLKCQSYVYDEDRPSVPVHRDEWEKKAHWKGPSAVKELVDEGLIQRDYYNNPSHSGGKARPYHYQFSDEGLNRLRLLRFTRDGIHGNTFNSLQRKLSNAPKVGSGLVDRLASFVGSCEIRPEDLTSLIGDPNFQMSGDVIQAVKILNNSHFCTRSGTERRVHTSFSVLRSDLKSLVSLDGYSDLVEVDVSASNPFLLAHRLRHRQLASQTSEVSNTKPLNSSVPLHNMCGVNDDSPILSECYGYSVFSGIKPSGAQYPPDSTGAGSTGAGAGTLHNMCGGKSSFQKLCLNGEIYSEIANTLEGVYKKKKPGRDDGKMAMMLLVNQSMKDWRRGKSNRKKYKALKERWPEEIRWLEKLKEWHDQPLGVSLMREEAMMVIDRVGRDLLNYSSVPFLTAHDGIYVPRKYGGAVKQKVKEHYERVYGVAPQITIN